MSDDFSLPAYRALLQAFMTRGYAVRGYDDVVLDEPHLILRHDLDMSLDAAQPIAEIEHSLGVRGHYFVLLRTEMYNPFSARAVTAITNLCRLGHEVGLHIDGLFYGNDLSAIEVGAATECDALEQITGTAVQVISFHRPAKTLFGRDGKLAGRRHAYEPRFFSQMGYCSDSRGAWHFGHPLEHTATREGRALQLLTHPIWWVSNGLDGAVAKLDRFIAERTNFLCRELAANCEPYRVVPEK
jgi:hypothetical protein